MYLSTVCVYQIVQKQIYCILSINLTLQNNKNHLYLQYKNTLKKIGDTERETGHLSLIHL